MSDEELAPEWMHNYGLTWSGRWHIRDAKRGSATFCGVYAYARDEVPRHSNRLQRIKSGAVQAPYCKKCEKAVHMPRAT